MSMPNHLHLDNPQSAQPASFRLASNTRVGAVTLRVADLAGTTRFYESVVGLSVFMASSDQVELGAGSEILVRLQYRAGGRYLRRATGLYHLALRLPTQAALGQWLRHYMMIGTPHFQGASDHGVSEALYLSDPEGNGIEIYRDRPESQWTLLPNGEIELYTRPLNLEALISAAPDSVWKRLPPATDMGHIHLKVNDLSAARAFYIDTLGFEAKATYLHSALFVAAGTYHHHLGLNIWESRGAEPLPENGYGLAEACLIMANVSQLEQATAQLSAAGYPLTTTETGDYIVDDPAGNRLRLISEPG